MYVWINKMSTFKIYMKIICEIILIQMLTNFNINDQSF